MAHVYNGILLSHKKKWNNANTDGHRDHYTKWSKPEKDKHYMIVFICRIYKNDTNELIYKTEIDSQTINLLLLKGKWGEG